MNVDSEMLRNRIGSLAFNAVQELRAVIGRAGGQFIDADTAAVKAIEAILEAVPHTAVINETEALPLVLPNQPEVNPALNSIRNMLTTAIDEELDYEPRKFTTPSPKSK